MEHPDLFATVRVIVGRVAGRMERPYTDERVGLICSRLPSGRFRFIFVVPPEMEAQYRGYWPEAT